MSYILNALRKSEQERQESDKGTLENRIQSNPQTREPQKNSKGLIFLVLINLFFLLYFAWTYSKSGISGGEKEVFVPVKQVFIPLKPEQKIELKPVDVVPSVVEREGRQQLSIAEQIEKQNIKRVQVSQSSRPKKQKKTQTLLVKHSLGEQQKKTLKAAAVIAIPIMDKQQDGIPFLATLDYAFRRKVPKIDINVYVYAEKQQDRFIMIEMKKYQTGQEIALGLELKEIRINSLVVEYKSRTFQIKRN